MANNTAVFYAIPNNVLLCSVVFKLIAMIIGVLGNVTVIIHTIFSNKEKTATSYLVGNLALADLLMCLTFYPTWIIEFIQIMLNIDNDQDLFCKFSRSTRWTSSDVRFSRYTSCNQWRSQPDNLDPLWKFQTLSLFISLKIDCFSQSMIT